MINAGAIMVSSLVKAEMNTADRFEYMQGIFRRLAGDLHVGFNNSIFLAEREVSDRNYALAYYMKENKCFPKGSNIKDCLDFWYQV